LPVAFDQNASCARPEVSTASDSSYPQQGVKTLWSVPPLSPWYTLMKPVPSCVKIGVPSLRSAEAWTSPIVEAALVLTGPLQVAPPSIEANRSAPCVFRSGVEPPK